MVVPFHCQRTLGFKPLQSPLAELGGYCEDVTDHPTAEAVLLYHTDFSSSEGSVS